MDFNTILGSSVIAALISALIAAYGTRRQDKLKYITSERKEWRSDIRKIASQIQACDNQKELLVLITDLEVRINAYGVNENKGYKNYLVDSHIWDLLNGLKKEIKSTEFDNDINQIDSSLNQYKNKLLKQLSLLLKHDWERAKSEVKDDWYNMVSIFLLVLSYIVMMFLIRISFLASMNPVIMILGSCVMFPLNAILFVCFERFFDNLKCKYYEIVVEKSDANRIFKYSDIYYQSIVYIIVFMLFDFFTLFMVVSKGCISNNYISDYTIFCVLFLMFQFFSILIRFLKLLNNSNNEINYFSNISLFEKSSSHDKGESDQDEDTSLKRNKENKRREELNIIVSENQNLEQFILNDIKESGDVIFLGRFLLLGFVIFIFYLISITIENSMKSKYTEIFKVIKSLYNPLSYFVLLLIIYFIFAIVDFFIKNKDLKNNVTLKKFDLYSSLIIYMIIIRYYSLTIEYSQWISSGVTLLVGFLFGENVVTDGLIQTIISLRSRFSILWSDIKKNKYQYIFRFLILILFLIVFFVNQQCQNECLISLFWVFFAFVGGVVIYFVVFFEKNSKIIIETKKCMKKGISFEQIVVELEQLRESKKNSEDNCEENSTSDPQDNDYLVGERNEILPESESKSHSDPRIYANSENAEELERTEDSKLADSVKSR